MRLNFQKQTLTAFWRNGHQGWSEGKGAANSPAHFPGPPWAPQETLTPRRPAAWMRTRQHMLSGLSCKLEPARLAPGELEAGQTVTMALQLSRPRWIHKLTSSPLQATPGSVLPQHPGWGELTPSRVENLTGPCQRAPCSSLPLGQVWAAWDLVVCGAISE